MSGSIDGSFYAADLQQQERNLGTLQTDLARYRAEAGQPSPDSGLQYGRACSLVVAPPTGIGLELSNLRVRFQVRAFELSSPSIRLDNASIQRARLPVTATDPQANKPAAFLPKIDTDGIYRILAIDYSGDTRGIDWYCNVVCIALDDTVPLGAIGKGGTASPETAAAGPVRPQP